MRGGGGAAGVRAGCLGFSLLGLLVGVGLTVWLGSMVLDGTGGGGSGHPSSPLATDPTATTVTEPPTPALAVAAAPRTGLRGGEQVVVTSDAFRPGEAVVVTACTAGTAPVSGPASCDDARSTTAAVDASGHLSTAYPVDRVVTVGGLPYDCAEQAGRCRLEVHAVADATRRGSVALAFAPGLGAPEITLPD